MAKKNNISDEDIKLFRQTVGTVNPLKNHIIEPYRKNRPAIPRQTQADEKQVMNDLLSDYYEPDIFDTGDDVSFMRSGLQNKVFQKLKRGQYVIGAELDLHGLIVSDARQSMIEFINQCQLQHRHCIKIIHGKGYGSYHKIPVLKQKVASWLVQRNDVLAFATARPVDGGSGALYVLLKKKR